MEQAAVNFLLQAAIDPLVSDLVSDFCLFRGRVKPRQHEEMYKEVNKLITKLYNVLQDRCLLSKLRQEPEQPAMVTAVDYLQDLRSASQADEMYTNLLTAMYILAHHPIGNSEADPVKRLNSLLTILHIPMLSAEDLLSNVDRNDIKKITANLDLCLNLVRDAEV